MLQGCQSGGVQPIDTSRCGEKSQSSSISIGWPQLFSWITETSGKNCASNEQAFWQRALRTVYAYTGFQAYHIDFSQFQMDISTSNVQFQNQPANINIKLFSGKHLLDERQFALNSTANTLRLANPQAVQHWVEGFDAIADGYSVQVSGMQFANPVGQYSMNATAKLGNQQIAVYNYQGQIGNDCADCVMK
ncbi:MAG: hypothetical protein ACK4GU_12900 [Alishewanella aestuarii]